MEFSAPGAQEMQTYGSHRLEGSFTKSVQSHHVTKLPGFSMRQICGT